MKHIIIAIFTVLVIAGCATKGIVEPKRNPKDPSLVRLRYYVGKTNTMMLKKLEKRYGVVQKKYGTSGRFFNSDHSFTYFYKEDKLVKLVLPVQQPVPYFRAYTGKLPYGLLRKDTYDSVIKKLGKPSQHLMKKTIIKYDEKQLTINFNNGTISTITLESD